MVKVVSVTAIFLAWCTIVRAIPSMGGFADSRLLEDNSSCTVPAQTYAGAVCGTIRTSYNGASYASFRGIPYVQQPLGDLRFVAPQPLIPWDGYYNASIEGPICPQRDFLYGPMLKPNSMGEDCLHLNVHVPEAALPESGSECSGDQCLPVLVFLPGGAFHLGSGDSDINGPEYLMDHDIVYISLNYRLGPFGFLSLNSSSVPGNAGLRDIKAALEWVKLNARAFGGDPERVTLMGQSAGAASAHILSLSEAIEGLFTKVILMSGTSASGFFSTTPSYAQFITSSFLTFLGINSTDPEEILDELNKLPYETILDGNSKLLESTGFGAFVPVVESQIDGVTAILDEDPDLLVARGRGNKYPLLIGFTAKECESLRPRLESYDIISKIKQNPTAVLPPRLLFSASPEVLAAAADQVMKRYFNGTPTLDQYIPACSDSYLSYGSLKLAQSRPATGGAPVFLYQFSYNSDEAPVKQALGSLGVHYDGAAHLDDLTYVLRVNSILQNTTLNASDERIKDWMTNIVINFMHNSMPTSKGKSDSWPAVRSSSLQYQNISGAAYGMSALTTEQQDMVELFDSFYKA